MVTVIVLISAYLGALLIGKHARDAKWRTYLYVAFVALLQTGYVLYYMLSKTAPSI
jgi:hypothetical protein